MHQRSLLILICVAFPTLLSCGITYTTRTHQIEKAKVSLPPANAQAFLPKGNPVGSGNVAVMYAPRTEYLSGTAGWESTSESGQDHFLPGNNNYHALFGGTGLAANFVGYSTIDYQLGFNILRLDQTWMGRFLMGLRMQANFGPLILGAGVHTGLNLSMVDYSSQIMTIDSTDNGWDDPTVDTTESTENLKNHERSFVMGLSVGASWPGKRISPYITCAMELPSGYFPDAPEEVYELYQQSILAGLDYKLIHSWSVQFALEMQTLISLTGEGSQSGFGARFGLTYR